MIAKVKTTANLGLFAYLLREDKEPELFGRNMVMSETSKEIAEEFRRFSSPRRLKKPYIHLILSFDIGDKDQDIVEITADFAEQFGLDDHQWIAVAHEVEGRGVHVHIAANRVSPNYRVFSDKMIGLRVRDLAIKLNLKYGLRNEYAKGNHAKHSYVRSHDPMRNEALQLLTTICEAALRQSKSANEFYASLKNNGVMLTRVLSRNDAKLLGYRMTWNGYHFKASEVGRKFSIRNLNNYYAETKLRVENNPAARVKHSSMFESTLAKFKQINTSTPFEERRKKRYLEDEERDISQER